LGKGIAKGRDLREVELTSNSRKVRTYSGGKRGVRSGLEDIGERGR